MKLNIKNYTFQTDTYFTIDSINKKYDYYNENNQYKGEIQEVEEDLYFELLYNIPCLYHNILTLQNI